MRISWVNTAAKPAGVFLYLYIKALNELHPWNKLIELQGQRTLRTLLKQSLVKSVAYIQYAGCVIYKSNRSFQTEDLKPHKKFNWLFCWRRNEVHKEMKSEKRRSMEQHFECLPGKSIGAVKMCLFCPFFSDYHVCELFCDGCVPGRKLLKVWLSNSDFFSHYLNVP